MHCRLEALCHQSVIKTVVESKTDAKHNTYMGIPKEQ